MDIFVGSILVIGFVIIVGCLFKLAAIQGLLGGFIQFIAGHTERYSKDVDKTVNRLIDQYANGHCNCTLTKFDIKFEDDGLEVGVWIANKYYGYGSLYFTFATRVQKGRCSWKTAKRLMKLEEELGGN